MMNHLEFASTYLKEVQNLRFEWALKITPAVVKPRSACVIWVTNYDKSNSRLQLNQLHELLAALNCPPFALNKAKKLMHASNMQGLLISLEEGSNDKALYIQYNTEILHRKKNIGFKWNTNELTERNRYDFNYFKDATSQKKIIDHIHPGLRKLALKLLEEPLLKKSGYYCQWKEKNINEVYFTYPWHPSFSNITDQLKGHFNGIDPWQFDPYKDHFYRHIGFSTVTAQIPIVTVYFSAGYNGTWPSDFESLKELVREEAAQLNKKLNYWVKA